MNNPIMYADLTDDAWDAVRGLDRAGDFTQSTMSAGRKIRQFYLMYPIWDSARPELTWTHYRSLMRIEEQHIRNFYMEEAVKENWSVRQLERQIATCSYSRVIANKSEVEKNDNIGDSTTLPEYEPNTVIKDPYMLEFLGFDNDANYVEKELEEALINHLQKFLLELGRGL